jgi:hypothetical protein
MTYEKWPRRVGDTKRQRILKSKRCTFVHKSIEKTQKYLNFWVFLLDFCVNEFGHPENHRRKALEWL